MHPFDPAFTNNDTIIDQAFQNSSAPPAQHMMMPMAMPMDNQNQTVPNVMMDMHQQNFQQQNVSGAYMNSQQTVYPDVPEQQQQQQIGAYDANEPHFDIEDPLLRRQFFRNVLTVLLVQRLCAIPILVLFKFFTNGPVGFHIAGSLAALAFLIFIVMYIFSDYRRYTPVNYVVLIMLTLLEGVQGGFHAANSGILVAIASQLSLVSQLFIMILFSKQSRFKISNLNGAFLALFMYLVLNVLFSMLESYAPHAFEFSSAIQAIYSLYDLHLQLSGHHAYNLKAEEHIFGACNIYADIPNFWWRLFRFIFIEPILKIYRFFTQCCFAEVC